ncbi:MAG TPA: AAA family ATPase [Spirochaetia bacterium]|nr:AAA family ATPase [Spirochaetia bacterium]
MIKRYKTGLIVGKFIPLHKGHQFLIESALKKTEKLTIIVCQNDNLRLIDPEVRAGWIKELYPQIKVIIYHHGNALDSTSTDISPIWADLTVKLLGYVPDVIFSSEEYGKTYAECMGSAHVMVDNKRRKYPISGTLIRSNPYQYWQFLSEPVRGYYSKRVVILGAESTGTTTLTKALARHYRTSWAPEYGRTYCEGRRTAKNRNNWTSDEFIHIASVQNAMEDFLARKSNKLLLCDTDAFATRLWYERYLGSLYPDLDKITHTQNKSLYILTGDEIPFEQDGTRDGEHIRHQMHQRFIEELNKYKLKYILVTGSRQKRLKKAIQEINKLFLVK